MKSTLQLDDVMAAYAEYAAAIEHKPVTKFVAKLRRQFSRLHPSLKRCYTVQTFAEKEIEEIVHCHERENRLPQSYTYSNRNSARERCWNNMLSNRAALAT